MAVNRVTDAVRRLARRFDVEDRAALPDGQLLALYADRGDEAALEALVRRHGRMVLGVCRRVLGHHADADDAFQATFLVLVRKARSIRSRDRLAPWLYGVARTTAVRAKALRAKRRVREGPLVDAPDLRTTGSGDDRLAALDEELARLPEKYRVPIVLCELGGWSHKAAASHLGWPIGTLSGRLSRGRQMLADRLARRGLPALLGAALLSDAGVPGSLAAATVRTAGLLAAGAVPARVSTLMEGVLKVMLANKLKGAAPVLVVLAMFGTGGIGYRMSAADEPARPEPAPKPDPREVWRRDHQALQGGWVFTERRGDPTAFGAKPGTHRWHFAANKFEMFDPSIDGPRGLEMEGTFAIETQFTPRKLNITVPVPGEPSRGPLYAIYRLDGDRLEVAFNREPDEGRPKDFDCPAGSRKCVVEFRRVNDTEAMKREWRAAWVTSIVRNAAEKVAFDGRLTERPALMSAADGNRRRVDALGQIERVARAERERIDREMNQPSQKDSEPGKNER